MKAVVQYFKDVAAELKKVVWPTKEVLITSTFVVILISLVFAAYIMGVDWILNKVVGLILEG